jgi:hypothetical protein
MAISVQTVRDLVAVIQQQLASRVPAAPKTAGGRPQERAAARARYTPDRLAPLIAQRVGQIGADDPQRGRKALRVFLEAVLLAEFGERLVNDSRFHQLVDDVQLAMESDATCAALIERALSKLLGTQGKEGKS